MQVHHEFLLVTQPNKFNFKPTQAIPNPEVFTTSHDQNHQSLEEETLVAVVFSDWFSNKIREMLTSALRALVKNLIKESFDITFIGNEKNCQIINCFFFFSYKNFL